MKETSKVRKIAFVGDHLPRKCGIATFTSDLLAAVASAHPQSQCLAVSVNDIEGGYEYPEVVRFEIEEQDLSSYLRAADFLNISNVDIVCLQHEFGIFGGPAGAHILAFLRELRMPVVTTLHTVLREPRPDQRRVMQELISLSTRVVVMTEHGRRMLQETYEAPSTKIDLIAHGIPESGRRRRAILRSRWPPSAAQTARAVFPHAAFTKSPCREDAREGEVRVS
jgi:glycosyltransferase involved in cell wall biosynthesis